MGFQHHLTPKKVRVQALCDHYSKLGKKRYHEAIFRECGVSHTAGWNILRQPREYDGRTFHSTFPETRGRKKLISKEDLAVIERFIDTNSFDGRTVPWAGLPAAAGLDLEVSGETVRRAVKDLNMRMCVACERKWISTASKEKRMEYCRIMLEKYPEPRD